MKVTLRDSMGSDLTVVNAARVSFGKRSEWDHRYDTIAPGVYESVERLKPADAKLIQFLARGCTSGDWDNLIVEIAETGYAWMRDDHDPDREDLIALLNHARQMPTHWTPFGQCNVQLHIKAPIFVARQLFKHTVGSVKNEVSRRYVTEEPEFWFPKAWRKASADKKQGSGDPCANQAGLTKGYLESCTRAVNTYNSYVASGVCPEQARAVLPQSMYTEWVDNGTLYYWASVYRSRSRADAQKETQDIVRMIGEIIEPLFPVSWKALTQ